MIGNACADAHSDPLDLDQVKIGTADAFLRHIDRNLPTALQLIFKTGIEREIYRIGGVEVCLDRGGVIAGRRSSPITEIELDLVRGDTEGIFKLASG